MSMNWLRERAPGFGQLSKQECDAITDFSLLWALFEARILSHEGNAGQIGAVIDQWSIEGALRAESYAQELAYFRQRYFAAGEATYHFEHLNLRRNDQPMLVRAVLDGSNSVPRDCMFAILIIILRFRNNLFHGIKWNYGIADQLQNFTTANNVLMKLLEHHGQLDGN